MQGYQIHTAAIASWHLIDPRAAFGTCRTERAANGGSCVVPVSPGHVRRLRPYPPSRRRRQMF
jgi:hypothetical protein